MSADKAPVDNSLARLNFDNAKRQFLISLAVFVVGWGVTIGTFLLPTDTFWVAWGAILFGGVYLVVNAIKLLLRARHQDAQPWPLIAGVTLLIAFGSMGGVAYYANANNPPDDSWVVLTEKEPSFDRGRNRVLFSGEVANTHDDWSIKDVKVVLHLPGRSVPTTMAVTPTVIGPGKMGTFGSSVIPPRLQSGSGTYQYEATWEWVKP